MTLAVAGLFLASIACDVVGQLCFKQGASTSRDAGARVRWLGVLLDPWVIGGVLIYAVEVMVWVRILSLVPLAVAFPIASLNFLAIAVASRWVLGEYVSGRRWAGAALVTVGVVLVAQGV